MFTIRNSFRKVAVVGAAIAVLATPMQTDAAAKEIKLTVLSGYSAKASWVRVFKSFWMPEVNQELAKKGNYKIKFNEAFGTIVKPRGEFEGTRKGLGDIGIIVSVFHPDKVPLTGISFVTPFVSTDLLLNAKVHDELTYKFPKMKGNWDKYNMEFLGHMAGIKNYAVMSRKPIRSLGDFKGLKIGGAGLNLRWVEGLGATGVPSALNKFYNDTKTGVYDGMIAWADAAKSFKLCEAGPYYLDAPMGAVTSWAVTVNKNKWKKLPKEVQDVMRTTTTRYRDEFARITSAGHITGIEDCKNQGGKIFKMPDSEVKKWVMGLPPIAKQWAQSIDKKGLPGTEVLKAYMDIMRKNNQPIIRHWDRD
jgi:C4-dicarboxylate-binding protein DctP